MIVLEAVDDENDCPHLLYIKQGIPHIITRLKPPSTNYARPFLF